MILKFEFGGSESQGQTRRWFNILMDLKNKSPYPTFTDDFEEWVFDNYGLRILHNSSMFPSHITGVEIEEENYTVLLLSMANVGST